MSSALARRIARSRARLGGLAAVAAAAWLVAPAVARATFVLPVTGPASAPQMVFDARMSVASVCLPVTNPAGGRSLLYGQRFTDGPVTAATPAIVLVHGIASSTEDWDFSPTWSVARALASAGYVVYSYDRLGYAQSPYFTPPTAGYTLTTEAHRMMLHDVVNDVKTGGYGMTASGDCSGSTTPGDIRSARVVVIGHSAGGWIVAGYPGEYHDVAAMVQADISGSAGGSASSPLGGNSQGGGFTPDPSHPSYFQFFQTPAQCYEFNTYPAGVVAYAAQIACTPPFLDSPYGEIADLPAKYAENDAFIAAIGPSIPVLLTSGAQDTTDPPSSAQADLAYYQAHCGCDVSQVLLPDTGHLFQVHRSLATWVDDVVNWLAGHGIAGTPAASGSPGTGSPSRPGSHRGPRCAPATGRVRGHSVGPIRLGWTRTRARRTLIHFTVTRNRMDNFCLAYGWGIRAGYPSARLLRSLPARARRRFRGRIIIALSANPLYGIDGIGPATSVSVIRRRLAHHRRFRIGRNTWYVIPGRAADGLLKVQRGTVQEVGLLAKGLGRGRAAQRRVLTSFPDA